MSIQFSDTVNRRGIIQEIEKNCGFNPGDISGNSGLLLDFTASVNNALDDAWNIILKSCGEWELDDNNYTDYPIMTTNLINGQYDYSFVNDGSGNLVLDIYRVMVMDTSGIYHEIWPISQKTTTQKSGNAESTDTIINFGNPSGANGIPQRYDKTGNAILLDPVPNYNATNGLKMFVNREAQYFSSSDTTKKPGFAGIFHKYLALKPSYEYAYRKNLANVKSLQLETANMERMMMEYYVKRDKDTPRRALANVENMH